MFLPMNQLHIVCDITALGLTLVRPLRRHDMEYALQIQTSRARPQRLNATITIRGSVLPLSNPDD